MLHSPHKQPQNHKCGANFLQEDSKKSPALKWLISAGHYQPPRPTESSKAASDIYSRGHKLYLEEKGGTMASNSLFSTVTACQQNFFWGYLFKLVSKQYSVTEADMQPEQKSSQDIRAALKRCPMLGTLNV
ncbi:Runt-related transcription factor 2 [Cricetulus griseus]|nr:Runt-related transcription factor 2 [Cricetulus griseus]